MTNLMTLRAADCAGGEGVALICLSLPICTCEWQVQHKEEMGLTSPKSMYLMGCRLRRWRLDWICSLDPIINSIYEMRENAIKISLHVRYPFGDFDLCA
jgi:hypothetical protein